ncbi:hypothetical protein [Povalibacter sp.]|uniref:hypothetical protein n=1 Tax=Povalibacter sp. TaxID=1962978 RepID=UPI002F4123F8
MSTRSPVLFIVFNRPDTTRRVFEAIRAARPPRLYVAADGPRPHKAGEVERCEEVRRIATAVDWPCELKTLMSDENLGCKVGESSGMNWFFENELEGIVLEDDCLPDPSFFTYCDDLLERYRDDPLVMHISGDNFISDTWKPEESYYFSQYVHGWGWASWRRAWQHYDVDMRSWRSGNKREFLERALPGQPDARLFWGDIFDRTVNGQIDTWDYQWVYACWKQGGLSCMPKINLISNIGFGEGATHTSNPDGKHARLGVGSLDTPLKHPTVIEASVYADRWSSENVFDIPNEICIVKRWNRRLRGRLGKLLRGTG